MASFTKAAAKVAGKAKGAAKAIAGYPKIFHHLAAEHAEVTTLMTRVAGSDSPELRDQLFPDIYKNLLAHAHAEEKELYPVLSRFPELKSMVSQCLEEHQTIEGYLEELQARSTADASWPSLFERLVSAVQQHVEREENQLFPEASELMSREQGDGMYQSYESTEEREKTALEGTLGMHH